MRRENYPIYLKAIQYYLACENQSFTRLLESPELGLAERTLLRARKSFSLNQYAEAVDALLKLDTPCDFLTAEKHLLLATAYSNLGEWENSFLHNGRSVDGYKKIADQRGHFLSSYNLSVDAGQLGLKKISDDYLNKASHLAQKLEEKLLIHRARACAWSAERKYARAKEEIKLALDLCDTQADEATNRLDILTLKVVASDLYFRAGDSEGALNLLESIRHEKLLKYKGRVFFNLSLIHLIEGKELGPMPKSVSESVEYSLKWKLIQSCISGELSQAKKLWTDLMAACPNHYLSDFNAVSKYDEESLFFSALIFIRSKAHPTITIDLPAGSKMEILHRCLSNSKIPLRKEELIESVWKMPYDPSLDVRFYKLIQRLKDMSLPITNENRAYYYKSS